MKQNLVKIKFDVITKNVGIMIFNGVDYILLNKLAKYQNTKVSFNISSYWISNKNFFGYYDDWIKGIGE